MGNHCCAGGGSINEHDWAHNKQRSPIQVKDQDKRIEVIKGSTGSFNFTLLEDGLSSTVISAENSSSKVKGATQSLLYALRPLSRREAGSRVRQPAQDLEDSPQVKANRNQHPNPQDSKDLTSLETESQVTNGIQDQLFSS